MAIVIKPITVEVSKPNVFQAIAAKQNDSNSRFLKVTFVNEGEKIYIIPSAKVTINAERKDGHSNSFLGVVNDDGTATVPIHSEMLELPGYVNCDVSIIEEDSKLTSTTFTLLVEEASHGSDDISTDEQYDVLTELINEVKSMQPSAIYGSAIPNSKSGTAVVLTDVSPIEHTLGVKARSANILPYPYLAFATENPRTSAGITYTDNGDRGIRIKGKATATEGFTLANIDLGGTYLDCSGGDDSKTNGTYTISKYLVYDHTTKRVRVSVKQGLTVDEIIYPQVVEGATLPPFIDLENMKKTNTEYKMDDYVYKSNGEPYNEDDLYGTVLADNSLMINSINNFAAQLELNGISIGEEYTELKVNSKQIEQGDKVIYISIGDEEIWGYTFNTPIEDDYVILRIKKSTAKIIDCGKNHFDKDNANIIHVSFYGKGSKVYEQGNYTIYIPCLPKQVYTVSKKGDPFTFLRMGSTAEVPAVGVTLVDFKTGGTNLSSLFMLTSAEARYLVVNITNHNEILSDEELAALLGDIQIELGQGATEYEPFQRFIAHPINADGTVEGVTSLYPTTTLISATEGVVLDATYNVDTKKYIDNKFAELAALIVNS